MREIEVKARLRDKDSFLKNAAKLGITFDNAVSQDDKTYETTIPYNDPAWNIFRIRRQDNRLILTMKHKASTRSRDNYEYETAVENEVEVVKMLERLGYTFGIGIKKKRRIAKYNDLELCLDEIEQLGIFVEVEKLASNKADVDAIQAELWMLLTKLGVQATERVYKGYDTLMHELIKSIAI